MSGHRGAHPEDDRLFAAGAVSRLREAAGHLAWLLSRGYALPSSLALVGNRFALESRQRRALARCVCSDAALARRLERRLPLEALRGGELAIDGYNVLTTLETALGGGVVLVGREGAHRDLAGVHGTWRRVEETFPALDLVARVLASLPLAGCVWYLDRSVSNSGRLAGWIREHGSRRTGRTPAWRAEVVERADPILEAAEVPVATSDGRILERCRAWVDLTGAAIAAADARVRLVDLRAGNSGNRS